MPDRPGMKVEAGPMPTRVATVEHQDSSAQSSPTLSLQVESVWGNLETIEELSAEWLKLCEEGPCNQPFYRPEWIAAVIRAFAPSRKILLITVREGTRLRAVLPLWEEKSSLPGLPFTKLHSATHPDYSCRFDIVHGDATDVHSIVRAVWEHLNEMPEWDAVELTNIPEGGAAEQLLLAARQEGRLTTQLEHVRTPYIILEGSKPDGDVVQFARSAKLRNNLRRGWRKLKKTGPVLLRRIETADPEELEKFYQLEQAGWKGKAGTAIACSPQTRQFYDVIARSAAGFGYFSLYVLEQSGSVVAADLGFQLAGNYYPTKIAYDEKYKGYGPGHLIVSAILDDLVRRGVSRYDWMGHHEDWKSQWTSATRRHSFCHIFRNTPAGRVLYADRILRQTLWSAARKFGRPLLRSARSLKARQNTWFKK